MGRSVQLFDDNVGGGRGDRRWRWRRRLFLLFLFYGLLFLLARFDLRRRLCRRGRRRRRCWCRLLGRLLFRDNHFGHRGCVVLGRRLNRGRRWRGKRARFGSDGKIGGGGRRGGLGRGR
uniref:(northern house mosquito) hypothetical protein n=1 Tax=Culex pipiens TaxID=7175 RepID=A0A8D8BDL9_CULPI